MLAEMATNDLKIRVVRAVQSLLDNDAELLEADVNERTLTHRIGVYLDAEFPGRNVDCEYNRNGDSPKRLNVVEPQRILSDDENARTVFPDIIVHRRRSNEHNLVVIEAKKSSDPRGKRRDWKKLEAFRVQYRYELAVFVLLHVAGGGGAAEVTFWPRCAQREAPVQLQSKHPGPLSSA